MVYEVVLMLHDTLRPPAGGRGALWAEGVTGLVARGGGVHHQLWLRAGTYSNTGAVAVTVGVVHDVFSLVMAHVRRW